ncbi:thioredoxin 1 [Nonlabens sp. Hel1_33_55]|uniref:thioredoxin family protein n=1 Tax=Nonlabens sp. Hel1_33_55 TaxID=1336802 RepID=UPI000875DCF6|nr:thioredoxin family protein [Nonlabens sp. Hel1_33_55]SCY39111.1 thioredoxin 1 [Nonlabens sp. Hel1_33_55]
MSKFGELISANVPVLFNFFTDWNEESTSMHPVLRDVAAALGDDARIIKINVDKNPELSDALRIKGLPTLIIYKRGEMKWRQSGLQDSNALITLLKQYAS